MQRYAHDLSSKIIFAHMNGRYLDLEKLARESPYAVTFYDKAGAYITGSQVTDINRSRSFSTQKGHLVLIDKSTFGHLGVGSILMQDKTFAARVAAARRDIILWLLVLYAVISVIGYFLARLFMQPITQRRMQLDNFIKESTHELNTPISALLMSVDAKGSAADKNDERIKISARRIADIYGDLTYLLLKEEQFDRPEPIRLAPYLHTRIAAVKPLAEKKALTVEERYTDDPTVVIDRESLTRLLDNLLSNAIKYNRPGGTITVETKERSLIISDTGIGIEKGLQKEIFKRFYRATDSGAGFGLGLNIVYKICKRYGIALSLDSEPNRGTRITLTFKD